MARSPVAARKAPARPTRLLIATRKGLWTLTSDTSRNGWKLAGPQFLGHIVHHAIADRRDDRLHLAAARTGHLGPTIFRSQDRGRTWKEAVRPPAFARGSDRVVDHTFWLTPGHADEPGTFYAGTSPQGLFRSQDGGATWEGVDGFNAHAQRKAWCGGDQDVFDKWHPVLATIGDQARYIGPIGAGSVAKLVHNCYGYIATAAAAEVFSMGVKAGIEPLAIWEAVRQGAIGRRGAFDSLTDQFLPNKYEPPAFALRLAHKDVSLATALGRELNVPMRLANLALADLAEGLNRGWGNRDSRSIMVLQTERAGVEIAVDPQRVAEALDNKAKNG